MKTIKEVKVRRKKYDGLNARIVEKIIRKNKCLNSSIEHAEKAGVPFEIFYSFRKDRKFFKKIGIKYTVNGMYVEASIKFSPKEKRDE